MRTLVLLMLVLGFASMATAGLKFTAGDITFKVGDIVTVILVPDIDTVGALSTTDVSGMSADAGLTLDVTAGLASQVSRVTPQSGDAAGYFQTYMSTTTVGGYAEGAEVAVINVRGVREGVYTINTYTQAQWTSGLEANDSIKLTVLPKSIPGPTLVMREPWVESDDVHTGEKGVNDLRLLWSEPILFSTVDVTIEDERGKAVPSSVSGSKSQFMIIAFEETLLNNKYTISIKETVKSVETSIPIDGDNDGLAGGDAVIIMEHRQRHDSDNNNGIDFSDLAKLGEKWMTGRFETVPDVAGMDQSAAERAIVAAGLTVGEVNLQYSETVAAGNVISQKPAANKYLAAAKPVDIIISFGLSDLFPDITWVLIDDSGAGMKDINGDPVDHGGFTGYMSMFETTNDQYCKYLNQALTAGHIVVSADGDYVIGATVDYYDEDYYYLAGHGVSKDGATNGGAARINYNSISKKFTVDSSFENHPVTQVSWYGATAFADHYGWRLPTEWQWQAVADYDGSYDWACGSYIHNGMANYKGSYHPVGTISVGNYGSYGYGMRDMAGNVGEWTSSEYAYGSRTIRDGNWGMLAHYCRVDQRPHAVPSLCSYSTGFRVVVDK